MTITCSLAPELVDQLALPEEHDVLGVLDCLFDFGREVVAGLPLLDLVDLAEGPASQSLNHLVSLVEYLLTLFHI